MTDDESTTTTDKSVLDVKTHLASILELACLSDEGIDKIMEYFGRVRDVTTMWRRFNRLLRGNDKEVKQKLGYYAHIDPADLEEFKSLRIWYQDSKYPLSWTWDGFNAETYNAGEFDPEVNASDDDDNNLERIVKDPELRQLMQDGPETPDTQTPSTNRGHSTTTTPKEPGSTIPQSDNEEVEDVTPHYVRQHTQSTNPHSSIRPMKLDFFKNTLEAAEASRQKFKNKLPYETQLGSHPTWQVMTNNKVMIDTAGFLKAPIAPLETVQPEDIINWYNNYHQVASQFGIHVIPLADYQPKFATFPSNVTSALINTMNTVQIMKLTQEGNIHPRGKDTELYAHFMQFIKLHGHEMLSAYNFIHRILQYTVTADDESGIPVPPVYNGGSVITYGLELQAFIAQHGSSHQYSPRRATLHFLHQLRDAGFSTKKDLDSVMQLTEQQHLPKRLEVHELSIFYSKQETIKPIAQAVTRSQTKHTKQSKDISSDQYKTRQKEQFYNPVPGAICEACFVSGEEGKSENFPF